ncbi:hypothetical protein Pmar_PMAR018289 [Perkinsus marinus ATCC 50983]|uniref:Transglutaminase-like domain-containing protein n=1 Tax=Perkinsus marinus (strain ATCC 50983 / TXsc) TaxID=423536 RepID=C5LVP9_PERM5|nr:hypothetical protein Pmar_PMAR018289 [Perkinsus marinus ATCC 50983]EEQ99172.1 hypothetical protein Pmar_PMAR018289 [Perkinsus marinus ATCC 50983]|eukprot:XP_002766455.1 hypothetical protein Pmar_PMAR018289 [Perkinsus marinus ATCC 50983]
MHQRGKGRTVNSDTALVAMASLRWLLYLSSLLCSFARIPEDPVVFLQSYQRPIDKGKISIEFLLCQVRQAQLTRRRFPWGQQVAHSLFLNDVLPFASLSEEASDFRGCNGSSGHGSEFISFMQSLVKPCLDATCAVMTLNEKAWEFTKPPITFVAAPPNEADPYSLYDVIERKSSSCTGLALYLVAALRSVGVPARVAGTPHWNKGDVECPNGDKDAPCGNHNWVEAYIPEHGESPAGWAVVDQRSVPLRALNTSFFIPSPAHDQDGSTVNHTIYAASFAPPEMLLHECDYPVGLGVHPAKNFPLVFDWSYQSVPAWNTTVMYHNLAGRWYRENCPAAAAAEIV